MTSSGLKKFIVLIFISSLSLQSLLASTSDGTTSGEITLDTINENQKTIMGQATILMGLTGSLVLSFCCFLCFVRNGYMNGVTQQATPDHSWRSRQPSSFEMSSMDSAAALAGEGKESPRGGDRA